MGKKYKNKTENKPQIVSGPHSNPAIVEAAKQLQQKVPARIHHSHTTSGHTKEISRVLTIRTTPIAWGVPMDEVMFAKFFSVFMSNSAFMPWDSFITTESTYLPDARNTIHNQFLTKLTSPFLVMIDSDVLPPPDFLNRLIEYDLPLVGGWYKKKENYPVKNADGSQHFIQRPVVYDFDSEKEGKTWYVERLSRGEGLERVDGAGAGLWLMRRDVAEALGESPYDMNSGGEDMVMCKKVYDLGFEIHVDWDIEAAHLGVRYV